MIVANIKDAKRYYKINSNFEKAFEYLKTLNKDCAEGKTEFDGFSVNVFTTSPADAQDKILEAHRDYLDIHYVISGSEAIGYADIDTLEVKTEYDKEGDGLLLKGDMYNVYLQEGDFCVVFPEDAHAPCLKAYNDKFKKAVVKIKNEF